MVKVVHFAIEAESGEGHGADGLLVNSADYVGKTLKTDRRVPGRLRADKHADFYEKVLGADEETVSIIKHGYNIPINTLPPETGVVSNNKSCETKTTFVWKEMVRYTQLGCVQEVDGPSTVMLPLSLIFEACC